MPHLAERLRHEALPHHNKERDSTEQQDRQPDDLPWCPEDSQITPPT
jgi:hypothetical protein